MGLNYSKVILFLIIEISNRIIVSECVIDKINHSGTK